MAGIDLSIDSMKQQLIDIKQKISLCRKKGFDTKVVELKVMSIPSKIKLVEVTKNFEDLKKIMKLLNDAAQEADQVEKEGTETRDTDLASQKSETLDYCMDNLDFFIENHNTLRAKEEFDLCTKVYKELPPNSKQRFYTRLMQAREKLLKQIKKES